MDYHFAISEDTPKKKNTSLGSIIKVFLPVFAISAVLPVFLFYLINPPKYDFTPQASQTNEIRVWFEPQSVETKPGQLVHLNLVASMEDEKSLVTSLKFRLNSDPSLIVTPSEIFYKQPFSGRVILGSIDIAANTPGQFKLQIPAQSIETTANFNVITGTADILVIKD